MKRLVISAFCLVFAANPVSAQDHPGWPRAELISHVKELLSQHVLEVKRLPLLVEKIPLLDPTEKAACFLAPEEIWESFSTGEFGWVSMFGDMDRIHTLWLAFPIVNVNDPTEAKAFYSEFFSYLFPSWQGAGSWAMGSMKASLSAWPKADKDPMVNFDEVFVREYISGAALATVSAPPDIVYFRVTSRAHCQQVSDHLTTKPRGANPPPATQD